jgi:hypothetical protein
MQIHQKNWNNFYYNFCPIHGILTVKTGTKKE